MDKFFRPGPRSARMDDLEDPLLLHRRRASAEKDSVVDLLLDPSIYDHDVAWGDAENERLEAQSNRRKTTTLVLTSMGMVLFGLCYKVLQKVQTYPMENYPIFIFLFTSFAFIPVAFLYIGIMACMGRLKKEFALSQKDFLLMGMGDGTAVMMQLFATTKIPSGALIVLVLQAAIPVSMVISKVWLRTKYRLTEYFGATVVMAGILTVLYPDLMEPHTDPTQPSITPGETILWCSVLALSCVPMCVSGVLKEKVLIETGCDVMFMNGFINVYQFLVGLVICTPAAYSQGILPPDIPKNLWDGWLCYLGHNTITDRPNPADNDDCQQGPLLVNSYLVSNVAAQVFTVLLLKHSSANMFFLVSTVIVPLANVAFSLPFVPGHQDITVFDNIGLIIIMAGILMYKALGDVIQYLKGSKGENETRELSQ